MSSNALYFAFWKQVCCNTGIHQSDQAVFSKIQSSSCLCLPTGTIDAHCQAQLFSQGYWGSELRFILILVW